ncbi:hypothetical protein PO909_009120 [Leuciscus waleckii]
MGHRSSRCKEAEKNFGHTHFHGSPRKSFTSLVEAHAHPVGVGEENVNGGKKTTKKKGFSKKKKRFRLWRWIFSWRAGQKYSRKTSSIQCEEKAQNTAVAVTLPPGKIPDVQSFLQQVICNVENQNHQEPSTSDPEILQAAEVHLAVHPSDWSIDSGLTPARTASDWSIDTGLTAARTASDWSINAGLTPARTASDWNIDAVCTVSDWSTDVTQTLACTASARTVSDYIIQTPARTTSDWSADIPQTPVRRTPSDWSIDVTQTQIHTTSDWNANVTQTSVHTASDWNANVTQTPVRTASDWSIGVGQTLVSPTEGLVSLLTRQLENNEKKTVVVINSRHYVISDKLGEGSFGAVYEGTRLLDGFKVAVKIVTKTEDLEYISIPCHSKPLPLEVALLILANRGPRVPEIIQLLDWQDLHDYYIMVLECPSPCEDLFEFAESHGGSIDEGLACVVMRQATQAAYMCCLRGVLHRDIKLENLLINKKTNEVKLIDFGCGYFLKKSAYKIFIGTFEYCPPEYEEKGEYNGKPATVWSLGVLLFALVCGDYPKTDDLHMINSNNYSKAGLSEECCHLISHCLQREPEQRLPLSEILLHDWFKVTDVEKPENSIKKRTGTPGVALQT